MGKPKVRAKKTGFGTANKPKCDKHSATMVYIADRALWECPEPGCSGKALPKRSDSGEPVIAEGPVELMVIQTNSHSRYLLRGKGNNVVHDITDLVKEVSTGRDSDMSPWDRALSPYPDAVDDGVYVEMKLRVPHALVLSEDDN